MPKPVSKLKIRRSRRRAAASAPPSSVISLRVDNSVEESLERYAHKSRRSLSEVVREALECWSASREAPLAADEMGTGPGAARPGLNY